MNRNEEIGFHRTEVVEEPSQQITTGPPLSGNGDAPYVPQKDKAKSSLKDNSRLLVIGAGIVLVLLLLAFNGISRRSSPARKTSAVNSKQPQAQQPTNGGRTPASVTPILDTGRSPAQDTDGSLVDPDQIARTAIKLPKPSPATSLGSVRPFDNTQPWQPAPFQPGSQPADLGGSPAVTPEAAETRGEHDAMDKASLVFVRNNPPSAGGTKSQDSVTAIDLGIGLTPGTRLRARLESAVNTAVRTPVVAVIEYNYEQNGEIAIPAGAKVFGQLDAADRSGDVGIHFDSLMMPDGSSVNLEATATDIQLRPLRGKVEGKHTGRNILVRSFAGVGEITATLAGRGNLNQPLSEGDLLRETVSNNMGQASDQTVANLALTQHVVVLVPAGTEIYVILQKPAKDNVQSSRAQLPSQPASQPSIEELRQLMQLQRELNPAAAAKP